MKPFVTTAPNSEPPAESRPAAAAIPTSQSCPRRPDLHARRRTPHGTVTGRHLAALRSTPVTLDPDSRPFAEFALRAVLEVLDRRRQPSGLATIVDASQLDLVAALARAGAPGRRLGAAALNRVHVRHVAPHSAEVFGTYRRGPRTFAIAARIDRSEGRRGVRAHCTDIPAVPGERATAPTGGWMVTSLRVG